MTIETTFTQAAHNPETPAPTTPSATTAATTPATTPSSDFNAKTGKVKDKDGNRTTIAFGQITMGNAFMEFIELLAKLFKGDMEGFDSAFPTYKEKYNDPIYQDFNTSLETARRHTNNNGLNINAPEISNNALLQAAITHLKPLEGFRSFIYKDKLGKLTTGMGHLLTDDDFRRLGLNKADVSRRVDNNERIQVPQTILQEWEKKDVSQSTKAAIEQAERLGITVNGGTDQQNFIMSLVSVNFQLGTDWRSEWNNTWAAIEQGNYDSAIRNIQNSRWMSQTPDRANDFIAAINDLKEIRPNGNTIKPFTPSP